MFSLFNYWSLFLLLGSYASPVQGVTPVTSVDSSRAQQECRCARREDTPPSQSITVTRPTRETRK